ncbi:hypothetical protein FRC09_000931 [Ceratobasidium sp. 395]|nr:hypothetical protein FRC09_000931 [Ceratobasidium sp. 395]
MSVELYILIRQIEPTKLSPEPLHFHRNPSIGSDTRAFWGFLSTSPDPCSPGVDPAEVGLKITYEVYEKMLQSGLASMPGGYPGSYIEEVEEDEAD